MSEHPRVICDFFVDHAEQEYICEIYSASDGVVDDFGIFLLEDDGSKGESFDPDTFPIPLHDKAQDRYDTWAEGPDEWPID